MKKLLITARLVLVSLFASSNHQSSQLFLTVEENRIFSFSLDQSPLSNPGRSFRIERLEPGYHYLYVVGYSYNHFHPAQKVLFGSYVFIPASSKIAANIDCNRSLSIRNIIQVNHTAFPHNTYSYPDNCNTTNPSDFRIPMSNYNFVQLKNVITSRAFESSKLEVARQAISSNQFLASQVAELMQLMTFESTRLELARCAYINTLDKQNYYLVNNAFTFESSIDELNRFILQQS